MTEIPDYPWDAMEPFTARATAHPGGLIDLSVGSPVDPTPDAIRQALASATDAHGYPQTVGTPALREAIVAWYARRRRVASLVPANVLPTVGSKEFVALLPLLLGLGPGDVVVHPRAAYPSYAVGAAIADASSLAADDPAEWPEATKLVWLNSPGNPDGRVLDEGALKVAVARARELGAVIANDECYAELGWEGRWASEPAPSILHSSVVGDHLDGVLSVYSLSKQSNLAGYRTAFVGGDAELIARLTTLRKHAGLMLPAPVQAAMVVALGDDADVAAQKERYRRRRTRLKAALESAGFIIDGSEAGLYLWATEGRPAWDSIDRLASLGIIAGPGVFYGEHFPNHVRFSLTASDERINAAAERLGG